MKEGYPETARNFAIEANIQPKADLPSIQDLRRIRLAIYNGDMGSAIEYINEVDPQVRIPS